MCCRVHIHIRYTPTRPSPGLDVAVDLWSVVFSRCFAVGFVFFVCWCCILLIKYCFCYTSLLICWQYIGKLYKNQSEIEQVFIYLGLDVQNTKAIQSQITPKRKALLYTLSPLCHCQIYTQQKNMHINQKSLSYVAKVNRCVANRQLSSLIICAWSFYDN